MGLTRDELKRATISFATESWDSAEGTHYKVSVRARRNNRDIFTPTETFWFLENANGIEEYTRWSPLVTQPDIGHRPQMRVLAQKRLIERFPSLRGRKVRLL